MNVALSRVDKGRLTEANLSYAPKCFTATFRIALDELPSSSGSDGCISGGDYAGLRRRHVSGAPGVVATDTAIAKDDTDLTSDPLAWFCNPSPRIALAQLSANKALGQIVKLAQLRSRLTELLDQTAARDPRLQEEQH